MDFNLSGGTQIMGFISPFDTNDTYAVIDPLYGIGGFRNVSDLTELNAIPNERRRAGMVVGVSGGTEYYKLKDVTWSGTTNDWGIFQTTTSGGTDNGIYGASFQDLYNLRGNEVPLSESINETIENINKSLWDKSVAVYFDNRYYIAVPLDYTDRSGNSVTATGNNAVLVYNFLNKAWESIDTIGQTSLEGNSINFEIQNMIVAGEGSNRGVYVVNSLGGVHRLEGSTNDVDLVITQVGQSVQNVTIESEITSRLYNAGTIDRKKWNSFEIQCQSSDELSSNFTIQGITENIDNLKTIGTLSSFNNGSNLVAGEDISIRGRIGNLRGYGFQFKISPTAGRPKIKIIKASGASTFKSTESAI